MILENSGIPLYLQLYTEFEKKIGAGQWAVDQAIPTEKELMEQYGVGRETVRRAVLKLAAEGYLLRQRGKGTFVCRNRREDGLEQLLSFSAEMLSRGYQAGAKLISLEKIRCGQEINRTMALMPQEKLLYMKRLRTANGLCVAVEESFLNEKTVGKIAADKLSGSFYNYLVYEKGITLGKITQEISSVAAGEETAKLLEVKAGHPLLQLTRLICTSAGQPFFFLIFRYRGDLYSIKTRL